MKSMLPAVAICAMLGVLPAGAAQQSAARVPAVKAKAARMVRSAWPAETLTGKVLMVEPARKMLVVEGPGGVPFDLVVTPATRIRSGERSLALKDLSSDTQSPVSVRFVPERRGDVARTIQVTG